MLSVWQVVGTEQIVILIVMVVTAVVNVLLEPQVLRGDEQGGPLPVLVGAREERLPGWERSDQDTGGLEA